MHTISSGSESGDECKTMFNPFVCTPEAEAAFSKLIQPDPSWQFTIEVDVDTSDLGVGAVLSQSSAAYQNLHPCSFFSCLLCPAEHNCDVWNHELLAVKLALEEWRH